MRNIVYASTSHSEFFQIIDNVSGVGRTGLLANSIIPFFSRMGSFASGFQPINIPATGLWIAGGFAEISGSFLPGLYRLDIPNEAWNVGTQSVAVGIFGTGIIVSPKEFRLSYFNDQITNPVPTANQMAAVVISSGVSTFNATTTPVTASGVYDKTGYSLTISPPTAAEIAAIVISSGVALTINIPTANQNAAVAIASGVSTFNPLQTAVFVSGLTNYALNQIVNIIAASGLGGGGYGSVGEPIAEELLNLLYYRR